MDRLYEIKYNKTKYARVQRLITLRIAKTYRTISHEALCIITGKPPINVKVEEAVALYNITTGRTIQRYQIDIEENPKYWLHPANTVKVNDNTDDTTDAREDSKHSIQVHTDGSLN